jgi:hypothetical protein
MLGTNVVDEELKRGFGLTIKEIESFLRAGGDAAEMSLWNAAITCGRLTE